MCAVQLQDSLVLERKGRSWEAGLRGGLEGPRLIILKEAGDTGAKRHTKCALRRLRCAERSRV